MNIRIQVPAAVLAVLAAAAIAAPCGAQSLADVARKEEARRKALKEHARVITNKDLGAGATVTAVTPQETPKAAAAQPPPKAAAAGAEPDAAQAPAAKGPVKDQAYWAKRMAGLRDALDRDQILVDALQSRINALTADFTARDDPAQRAIIEQDRLKALAKFNELKHQIEADKKAIDDLEEEARRAGVPPGWLRS
jgi:hypothetical protein